MAKVDEGAAGEGVGCGGAGACTGFAGPETNVKGSIGQGVSAKVELHPQITGERTYH